MRAHVIRPAAKELTFHLYARTLHPELFDICASRKIEHAAYKLVVRICEAGHVIELRRNGETVTEVSLDAGREIPARGRCLAASIGDSRDLEARPWPDVFYQASLQLEVLDPEVFDRLTQEFQTDLREATVAHVFSSRNRLRPEAVSLLFADCGPRSVSIHAFHTFPDDFAVVRTQSLYEFAKE